MADMNKAGFKIMSPRRSCQPVQAWKRNGIMKYTVHYMARKPKKMSGKFRCTDE